MFSAKLTDTKLYRLGTYFTYFMKMNVTFYLSLLLGPESLSLAAAHSRSSSSRLKSRDFNSSGLF